MLEMNPDELVTRIEAAEQDAEPNALVPNPLQLFRLGRQGAETETGFFREFSQLPSNPPTQALFSGKAL